MKRKLLIIMTILAIVGVLTIALFACGDAEEVPETLTVKFDAKGGEAIADIIIDGDKAFTVPTPTKAGYVFKGWYLDESYQTEATPDAIKQRMADGTLTIYAKWEKANFTIEYDSKGGSAVTGGALVEGEDYVLPATTREGYLFKGWYFEENYQTQATADGVKARLASGDVTLYAKWEELTLVLSFDVAGGAALSDMVVGYTAVELLALPTPVRQGYKFARWCFDEDYQKQYSAKNLKELFADGAVTLHAKWGVIMSNNDITIHGQVEDKVVLNPIFDWTSADGDDAYLVTLKDEAGESVRSGRVAGTHYELAANLAYSTKYTLEIVGATTDSYRSISFTTISGTGKANISAAALSVAEPFKSHMVIQRGKDIVIKGKAQPNVLVAIDFYGSTEYTVANESGEYSFAFPAREASKQPVDITLKLLANESLVIKDVLIGDVFLVSGQSNVQIGLEEYDYVTKGMRIVDYTAQDVTNARECDVRYYYQAENALSTPSDTTKSGAWSSIAESGDSYKKYSAISFLVGSMLGKALDEENVPVGILYAAKGDTNIVNWMSKDYYDGSIGTKNKHYNGMVYPLRNAEIKGVVWYQGCNNSAKGTEYEGHLNNLIANWRSLFRNEALPFYVVQLPVYNGDSGNNFDFSFVRESQAKVCAGDANAYLIATCDGGDPDNIHPAEKRYIAERITKSILSTLYGADYLPQGPTYKSHVTEGDSVVITVDNGEGLHVKSGEAIRGFMLAGADGKYFDATATISDGKIVVTSAKVAAPVYIKYGFGKCPFLNVYNKDGFLMSPFRTDENNHNVDLLDYREGAVYAYNRGGMEMLTEVADVDGEVALQVTKTGGEGEKGYGILELEKWGAIGYDEHVLKLRIKGSGSGAKLVFRIVESSYETWATPELVDDFTTVREFNIPISYFSASNEANGILDLQSIMRVELVIKDANTAVTVAVLEARFVDFTRTAPAAFAIKEAKNDGHEVTVKYGFSDFATSYRILVSADGTEFTAPIVDVTTTEFGYVFNAALCEAGVTYYVKVIAVNELGQVEATGSGTALLDLSQNVITVAAFDFDDDEDFNEYVGEKIYNEHTAYLEFSNSEKGLKVHVKKTSGWMAFFIRVPSGTSEGFDGLRFYADLTEYKGNSLKVQLQTNGGGTSYTCQLKYSDKKEGYFEIPFSSFKTQGGDAYGGENIDRVKFGFEDYTAGEGDNVYINNVEFIRG